MSVVPFAFTFRHSLSSYAICLNREHTHANAASPCLVTKTKTCRSSSSGSSSMVAADEGNVENGEEEEMVEEGR